VGPEVFPMPQTDSALHSSRGPVNRQIICVNLVATRGREKILVLSDHIPLSGKIGRQYGGWAQNEKGRKLSFPAPLLITQHTYWRYF
jgi:hypothetical protein